MEESPFKTPSKFSVSQMLPSSGSASPFTPKRSRIIRKSDDGGLNSVSRSLKFDDSNSVHLPYNGKLEFLPLTQQVPSEYERSEQTRPVKTQQQLIEKNSTVLLSPSIRNRPNRFNIVQQKKKYS